MNAPQRVYLDTFLAPLAVHLARDGVTDVYINKPGEMWLVTTEGVEHHAVPQLDDPALWRLARQIAAFSDQGINREHPLLAATLPDGARVQICAPPATRGAVIVAIRKHAMPDLRLSDYIASGAFSRVGDVKLTHEEVRRDLSATLAGGDIYGFLCKAVRTRQTIVVSGGTGCGKTTFLNAMLKEANHEERLIIIEDTPEIQVEQPNVAGLVAVRGRLGEALVTPADLVEAALRLRPDRIIMGEIRGGEAISWLRAVGTGHPGSITTVHANSPSGAIEQLALMCLSTGTELRREELISYIRNTVDVVVQLGHHDGQRMITEISFESAL